MRFEDFEYDGKRLSDFGYMICEFNSNSVDIIKGAEINLNTVSNSCGTKNYLVNSKYNNVLEDTFQICKNTCDNNSAMEISVDEQRKLARWLNRKNYHKFRFLAYDYSDFYFEATFNISYIKHGEKIYGLELEMTTNKPFALSEEDYELEITEADQTVVLIDESDDEGCIYPHMKITIGDSGGDFKMSNTVGDKTETMIIKNCTANEVITVDYPIIYSSVLSHKVQKDFNWKFFGISNTNNDRANKITISLPCKISMGYSPAVKLGL